MGYARCIVSAQFLINVLHLPPETEILGVSPSYQGGYCDLELLVAHPDLKAESSSETAPLVVPTWRKQDPIVFGGWGQE